MTFDQKSDVHELTHKFRKFAIYKKEYFIPKFAGYTKQLVENISHKFWLTELFPKVTW